MVVELTHRRHDLADPLGPGLDLKSPPVRTADRPAVHACPSSPFVTVRVTACAAVCVAAADVRKTVRVPFATR
ncbi:hypothetical protein GCM10010342_57840 [Streptomyces anulatus]|nr:hypothetical protein GCM10010342_57840 [Streptomyces anulatus]